MKLSVTRKYFSNVCTVGELHIGGVFVCYTLEDRLRVLKIDGSTAIPAGLYKLVFDYSERFKRVLPRLLDVPDFTGVRIHPGNTDKDTEGCILVGKTWSGGDFIGQSGIAFADLIEKISGDENAEIEIS